MKVKSNVNRKVNVNVIGNYRTKYCQQSILAWKTIDILPTSRPRVISPLTKYCKPAPKKLRNLLYCKPILHFCYYRLIYYIIDIYLLLQ